MPWFGRNLVSGARHRTAAALSSEWVWAEIARDQIFSVFFNRFVTHREADVLWYEFARTCQVYHMYIYIGEY